MTDVWAVLTELRSFLGRSVEVNGRKMGSAVTLDPGYQADSLCIIIAPPELTYEAGCGPTEAISQVVVIAPNDSNAVPNLLAMVDALVDAIDGGTLHSVLSANPGTWLAGNRMIPMYALQVGLDLSEGEAP